MLALWFVPAAAELRGIVIKNYIKLLIAYTLEGDAPDKCPLCNTPKEQFITFD